MSARERMEAALWEQQTRRLAKRWRTLAERIEPYAPPAAAYRQAAEDVERELADRGGCRDAVEAILARMAEVIGAGPAVPS